MKIFELFGSIFVDTDEAEKSISKTDKKAQGLGSTLVKGIGTAAKWGAALAGGAAIAAGAAFKAAGKFAETTDRIDKMSQRLGLSRKGFQEWDFVLSQAGISIDSMQSGMKSLSQRMDQSLKGVGLGAELFDQLGVSVKDANGEVRNQQDIFEESILALQNMEDGVEKASLAQKLFGRSGQELLPLLNSQAGSIDELKQQAQELGLILGDDAVDAGVVFTDTMDKLKRAGQAVFTSLVTNLMPTVQGFVDLIIANMPVVQQVMGVAMSVMEAALDLVVPILENLIEDIIPELGEAFEWLTEDILPELVKEFEEIADNVIPPLMKVFDIFTNTILPPLIDILGELIEQVLPRVAEMWKLIAENILPPVVALFEQIVNAVLPPLLVILEQLANALIPIIDLFIWVAKEVLPELMAVFQEFTDFVLPIVVAGLEFLGNTVLPFLITAFENVIRFVKPLLLGIVDLFKFVIAVISGDWTGAWDAIVSFTKNIFDAILSIADTFGGVFESIFSTVGDIIAGIWDGIVDGIKASINFIIEGINFFIRGLNLIKIPDWVPGVGGKGIDIGQIPMLAEGGDIIQSGTVIVGEAGPEMLTLPKGARVTPLDEEEKASSGGINQTIIVNSPTALSPSKVARKVKQASRDLALGLA